METLKCNSLVQKTCMFLQEETSKCRNSLALGTQGPKQYNFGNCFYSNNARKLRFHVFLLFHVKKHITSLFYLKWTEFTRNCEFFPNGGLWGPELNWNKFTFSYEFDPLQVKWVNFICFLILKWRNTWNLSFQGKWSQKI